LILKKDTCWTEFRAIFEIHGHHSDALLGATFESVIAASFESHAGEAAVLLSGTACKAGFIFASSNWVDLLPRLDPNAIAWLQEVFCIARLAAISAWKQTYGA